MRTANSGGRFGEGRLRARRAIVAYDAERQPLNVNLGNRTKSALERFLSCLTSGDVGGVESLQAAGVKAISDGGGEFAAARVPVIGAAKVAGAFAHRGKDSQPVTRVETRWWTDCRRCLWSGSRREESRRASRSSVELDSERLVRRIYTVMASRKLTASPFA